MSFGSDSLSLPRISIVMKQPSDVAYITDPITKVYSRLHMCNPKKVHLEVLHEEYTEERAFKPLSKPRIVNRLRRVKYEEG